MRWKTKPQIVQLHWIGRFGNRMFQYAFGCDYAHRYQCTYRYPSSWEGSRLFKPYKHAKLIRDKNLRNDLNQLGQRRDTVEYRKSVIARYNVTSGKYIEYIDLTNLEEIGKTDICFDSLHMMYEPELFGRFDPEFIRSVFEFSNRIKNTDLYKQIEDKQGTYDCAHVRRGDIAQKTYNGSHSIVSIESYYKQMEAQGVDPNSVVYVSDDPAIRTSHKWSKYCQDGWIYPEGQMYLDKVMFNWFPDFLLMYFSRKLFRGNSSIAWWAAFLGHAKVFSPVINLDKDRDDKGYLECDFVEGNYPHFMGNSRTTMFPDIKFGTKIQS